MTELFNKKLFFIYIILCNQFVTIQSARIKFTNVMCNVTDPTFAKLDRCLLKAVSRDVNYVSLKLTLLIVPVTDFQLRVQVMKKANGWKPFLYDITVGCNFTRHLNIITRIAWSVVKNVSNVQHDCPYNQKTLEALRVDNVYLDKITKRLPVPSGEYAFFATWKAYNVTRGTGRVYVVVY